ncbi:MAG: putative AbrB family transcriptional regulator [Promethearchaeota archaeon]|nr:MAG: putative AbrB family transcriptional regulator [Candidatus Lokiarchaeota archaeon]
MKSMSEESKISIKGQITIPKVFREKLGLKPGDKVIFESIPQGILLRKKEELNITKVLNEVSGIWKEHPLFKDKTTKEIIKMMRGPDDETSQT